MNFEVAQLLSREVTMKTPLLDAKCRGSEFFNASPNSLFMAFSSQWRLRDCVEI